jgi:WD40 repeat protein
VDVSNKRKILSVGQENGSLLVWDIKTKIQLFLILKLHSLSIIHVLYNPQNENIVLTLSFENSLKIVNVLNGCVLAVSFFKKN